MTKTGQDEKRHERCKYCRGVIYTDKPFVVVTQMGMKVEVQFNFCPNCGADLRERKDNESNS